MSSTMVVTMATTPPPTTKLTTAKTSTADTASTISCCPSCGDSLPPAEQTQSELLQAHARIAELEQQVRLLNQKATAAVDRWADYEDELSQLRTQQGPPPPPPKNEPGRDNERSPPLQSGTNRLSTLLSRNKSSPNLHQDRAMARPPPAARMKSTPGPTSSLSPATTTEDLLEALTREQGLRKEAEGRVAATSKEVEELSVSLFEQANEMVADERRARAKLEERVDELENRDKEKRRRLERLEAAMIRIEKVRNLLAE